MQVSSFSCLPLLPECSSHHRGTAFQSGDKMPICCTTDHLLVEGLPFVERRDTNAEVVRLLQRRMDLRKKHADKAEDKYCNSLIAIFGTYGSGKSAFLAHFGHSTEYTACALADDRQAPVLSTFSFDSEMAHMPAGLPTIALRVLYGVAKATCGVTASWTDFSTIFKDRCALTIWDAMLMIQDVFGGNRRVLVCCDEVEMAGKHGKEVMCDLARALCAVDAMDLVITSLLGSTVPDLISSLQRGVNIIPLSPMLTAGLGMTEAKAWAAKQAQLLRQQPQHQNEVCFDLQERILQAVPLLASGHCRTIDGLVRNVFQQDLNVSVLSGATDQVGLLIALSKIVSAECSSTIPPDSQLLEIVLCPRAICVGEMGDERSMAVRHALELNNLHIAASMYQDSCSCCMQLGKFLETVQNIPAVNGKKLSCASAAKVLLLTHGLISKMWERMLLLNMYCGIWHGEPNILCDLAVPKLPTRDPQQLTPHVTSTEAEMKKLVSEDNLLVVAPDGYDAFQAIVQLTNNTRVYVHAAVPRPSDTGNETMVKTLAQVLASAVEFHESVKKEGKDLSKMLFVFCDWSAEADTGVSTDTLAHAFDELIHEFPSEKSRYENAKRFIADFYSTHVAIIGQDRLKASLLPTLQVLPSLVSMISMT